MIEPLKIASSHEELFIDRYQRLLAWSLQLTGNERDLAEDLLHDAFVQFTFAQPDLGAIKNLDGYFYSMLRNLHLSQVRRETRNRWQQLSVIEYDSAEDGLRTTDLRDQLHIQDELRNVCQYVCVRKETARAASVLILRFFHGYYPTEIVQLLRTSRQAVDVQLLIARREARLSFQSPETLSFVGSDRVPEVFPAAAARPTDDFLNELRLTIFRSNRSDCFSRKQLRDLYDVTNSSPMECTHLAHLVSCPSCLDEVNRMLGLPLLAERNPTETLGRDNRPKGPGANGPKGGGAGISSFRRRARRVFEHKPQELCVAVNGYVQASHAVNSELSELNLNIDLSEDISFVEVFSEHELRLLMLSVDELPPAGPGERAQLIQMSDGRTLSLKLEFRSPWPTLQVAYHDPTFKEVQELLNGCASEDAVLSLVPAPPVEGRQILTPSISNYRSFLARVRAMLAGGFWLRPGTITAVVALVLMATLLLTLFHVNNPTPTAANLLRQASEAEQIVAARSDTVLHRMITVEEHDAGGGVLIARHRIEVWHSAEKGVTARRFFDDKNNLVAGEWDRGDVRTFYQHASKPERRTTADKQNAALLSFENAWQSELSAKEFNSFVGNAGQTSVEERPGTYAINYVQSSDANTKESAQGLVKATLVLSRAELHPIEQTFVVKQGNETREYRFMETSFERHAPTTVAPVVFEPESELLTERMKDEGGRMKAGGEFSSSPLAPSLVTATAELEVEVLGLVNQAGADLGDQVSVRRTPEGQLLVEGIVETDRRKDEVLRALAPVANSPAVKLKVETVAEALRAQAKSRPTSSNPISVERLESANSKIPADADLRRYFAAKGLSGAQLDQSVNQFAARMLDRSFQALRHAGALERLAQRFSLEQLRTLDPEARNKWLGLLRAHAQAVERELGNLRRDLGPFTSSGSPGSEESVRIDNDQDFQEAVHRLFELCSASDQAVRSAFTISESSSNASAIKSTQFFRSLSEAEALAGRISGQ